MNRTISTLSFVRFILRNILTPRHLTFVLIAGLLQAIVVFVLIIRISSTDEASVLALTVFTVLIFALAQVSSVHAGLVASVASGVVGIAPMKSAHKLFVANASAGVSSAYSALIMSVGIGARLSLQYGVFGGFVAAIAGFLWLTSFLMAGSSLLVLTVASKCSNGWRSILHILIACLFSSGIITLYVVNTWDPYLLQSVGLFIMRVAKEPSRHVIFLIITVVGSVLFYYFPFILSNNTRSIVVSGDVELQSTMLSRLKSTHLPRRFVTLFLWQEWVTFKRTPSYWIPIILIIGISMSPHVPYLIFMMLIGGQFGVMVIRFRPANSLSLLLTAPVSLRTLWILRVISLSPYVLFTLGEFCVGQVTQGLRISAITVETGLTLGVLGYVCASLSVMYGVKSITNKRVPYEFSKGKTYTLIVLITIIPFLGVILGLSFPGFALILNLVLILVAMFVGTSLLEVYSGSRPIYSGPKKLDMR